MILKIKVISLLKTLSLGKILMIWIKKILILKNKIINLKLIVWLKTDLEMIIKIYIKHKNLSFKKKKTINNILILNL